MLNAVRRSTLIICQTFFPKTSTLLYHDGFQKSIVLINFQVKYSSLLHKNYLTHSKMKSFFSTALYLMRQTQPVNWSNAACASAPTQNWPAEMSKDGKRCTYYHTNKTLWFKFQESLPIWEFKIWFKYVFFGDTSLMFFSDQPITIKASRSWILLNTTLNFDWFGKVYSLWVRSVSVFPSTECWIMWLSATCDWLWISLFIFEYSEKP